MFQSVDVSPVETTHQGIVFKKTLGHYLVDAAGKTVLCTISSRLRKQLIYPTADPSSLHHRVVAVDDIRMVDPVAIGDQVVFVDADEATGMITTVLPRRNKLSRQAAGAALEQVIVANIDQVVPVFAAAHPAPKWELLDRYLAAAELTEIPALVCITKVDLVDPRQLDDEVRNYRKIGYEVLLTSSTTGQGIDEFKAAVQGKVSVFAGKSGVGKTTLLNALQPGLGLRVNEVSNQTGKGKHTTTNLQMFSLECGGSVVDTPGMREYGLWDVDIDEIDTLFPEMRPYLGHCRFGAGCVHDREPGCLVKQAVADGAISQRRYRSYLRMRE